MALAEAHGLGRDLEELVGVKVFEELLEVHAARGPNLVVDFLVGRAHVGHLLGPHDIESDVLVLVVLAVVVVVAFVLVLLLLLLLL